MLILKRVGPCGNDNADAPDQLIPKFVLKLSSKLRKVRTLISETFCFRLRAEYVYMVPNWPSAGLENSV